MRFFCFGMYKSGDALGKKKLRLLKLNYRGKYVYTVSSLKLVATGLKSYISISGQPSFDSIGDGVYAVRGIELSNGFDSLIAAREDIVLKFYKEDVLNSIDYYYSIGTSVYDLASMCNFNLTPFIRDTTDDLRTNKTGWFAVTEDGMQFSDSAISTLAFNSKADIINTVSAINDSSNGKSDRVEQGYYMYTPIDCDGCERSVVGIYSYKNMENWYKDLVCETIDAQERVFYDSDNTICKFLAFLNFDITPFKEYKFSNSKKSSK